MALRGAAKALPPQPGLALDPRCPHGPDDFGKVSFYSLHNIRWDPKAKIEIETHTKFTLENLAAIQAEIESVIEGFGMVDLMLAS